MSGSEMRILYPPFKTCYWSSLHPHCLEFETEGEFYGEWFKILVEYQHDIDDVVLTRIQVYRDENVAYDPNGQYRPHVERHTVDVSQLFTEEQRLELSRALRDALAQIE
jgi:hypothetical protein